MFYKLNVGNSPEFLCDLIPSSVGETITIIYKTYIMFLQKRQRFTFEYSIPYVNTRVSGIQDRYSSLSKTAGIALGLILPQSRRKCNNRKLKTVR